MASALSLVLLAALQGAQPRTRARLVSPHVRGGDDEGAALLTEGIGRSATIRRLVGVIDSCSAVVYVYGTAPPTPMRRSATVLQGSGHGTRYLLIWLPRVAPYDRLAALGHELQHAVEIATSPGVDDQATMKDLYRRLGRPTRDGGFETDAAVAVGRSVLREVFASRAAPVPSAGARQDERR